MNIKPPFLQGYNPAGRIVFALTPGKAFLDMFDAVIEMTGRPLDNMLVSMYYLAGKRGPENLAKIRSMCRCLFVDSGVFSLRAKVYKDFDVSFHKKYWQLSEPERQAMVDVGLRQVDMFDEFAQQYAEFLSANASIIDVAIDLDVEQFLGYPKAEEYYQLLSQHLPPEKMMRVWHSPRQWKGWQEWCTQGHSWLAMEGGWEHDRDPTMYNRFIDLAHENGIKVHILAVTTFAAFRDIAFDTCDSSTYTVGGRWARLIMPNGRDILVGQNYKAKYDNHFDNLTPPEQDYCRGVMANLGFTVEELAEDHNARCLFNILVFSAYYDKPPAPIARTQQLF